MLFLFIGVLVLTAFGAISLQFFFKMSALRSSEATGSLLLTADRYRPMLRLLSNVDLAFVSADSNLQRKLRAKRRNLFRGYLRCLTRDYGLLLAGIRKAMVQSDIDRPDLAQALTRNRMLFAFAVCKIELRLALHAIQADNVDVSGLVSALETLCAQSSRLSTASIAA